MPFGIMAVNAIICGILCMTLPETNKVAMPDTVKQVAQDKNALAVNGDNEKLKPFQADHDDDNNRF
jgi:hypothetical protein